MLTMMRKRLNQRQADVLEHLAGCMCSLGLICQRRARSIRQASSCARHEGSQAANALPEIRPTFKLKLSGIASDRPAFGWADIDLGGRQS